MQVRAGGPDPVPEFIDKDNLEFTLTGRHPFRLAGGGEPELCWMSTVLVPPTAKVGPTGDTLPCTIWRLLPPMNGASRPSWRSC